MGTWFDPGVERDRPELLALEPHQKLLLLSDGSLTLELELLAGARVEVEVTSAVTGPLGPQEAAWLKEPEGTESMERVVWITANGKRLVYAHSIIPLTRINKGILEELYRNSSEPLGRILNSKKIFFRKERLEAATVRCMEAARDLGIDEKTGLLARRYVLFNRQEDGDWTIKAGVTEVFTPWLMPSKA